MISSEGRMHPILMVVRGILEATLRERGIGQWSVRISMRDQDGKKAPSSLPLPA